jgi:hypothetical protein
MIIERSADLFGAYAKNVKGVTGCGDTIEGIRSKSLGKFQTIRAFYVWRTLF